MKRYSTAYMDNYCQIWPIEFTSRATTRRGIIRAAAKAIARATYNDNVSPSHSIDEVVIVGIDEFTGERLLSPVWGITLTNAEYIELNKQISSNVFDLRYA